MRKAFRLPIRAALVSTLLVVGLAACGDDEDEAANDTSTTTAAAGADTEAYCEKSLAIETVAPNFDFESMSPEEQKEAVKRFAREDIRPLVDDIEKVLPEEIAAEGRVLISGIEKIEQTGDFEAFEADPEIKKAEKTVHAFDLANCGWEKSDVTGVEYAFEGLPATLKAGVHSFDFSNKGKEIHMIALLRAKDEVKESFDEILELPQEQAGEKFDFIGETTTPQGASDYFVADLKPGRYLAVCFISVGQTSQEAEVEGPPHFTRGMKTEIEVS